MIRCVIVEDEPPSAERLRILLERNHPEVNVLACLQTQDEAIEFLNEVTIDLAFFDVEIGENTAFDLLGQLSKVDFRIIFTTAHEAYALQAIKSSALDYLLKPIDQEELALALRSYFENENKQREQAENLIQAIRIEEKRLPQKLALPSVFGVEYIPVKELIRCQADVNYTHFFLQGGRKITVSKTLKEYENLLRPHGFYRVHNSHLVNLQEVRQYNKGKGGVIILSDGSEIDVASRRKEELLQLLKEF